MKKKANTKISPMQKQNQKRIKTKMSPMQRKEALQAYLFISPWIVGMLGLVLGPMIFSFITSFFDYNMIKMSFTGLDNYKKLFTIDPLVWRSFKNTLWYACVNIPVVTIGGIVVATLLNRAVWGMRTFRTIYYLPSIMVGVGTYFLWMLILNPSNGLINTILGFVGIQGPAWLSDPNWTKPSVIIMHVWGLGGQMLLYLARLQSIPQTYYEAASIDGAGRLTQFFKITVPMLSPIIFYNLTIGIIGAFQVFQEGYIFSGDGSGNPAGSLLFYNLHVWNNAFKQYKTGYANALCWMLFVFIMILTAINRMVSKKWVFEEGS